MALATVNSVGTLHVGNVIPVTRSSFTGRSLAILPSKRLPCTGGKLAIVASANGIAGGKTRFHKLIQDYGVVLMPGCYDALSAAILEKTGFDAGFISGYAMSAALLGKPDFGFLT